jgi:outer membrane protein assembly factor BamB
MFGYCPTHPGRSPYAGPTSAVLKWTAADANLAGGSIQPAIAADGTIYVGGYGSVWAIEPVHGKTKWTYSTANQPVRSTPAIGADGTIYVGTDGPTKFVALEPTHGQELWHYTAAANVGSSPLIGPDGSIYFGSDATDLYALDRTGAFMWQLPTMGAVGLSPALGLDGMRIYVGSGMTVFGVSPSAMFATTPNTIASSPVVGVAGVYVGTAVGGLWGLNADLTQQWFYPVSTNQPALDATPAIGPDGTVYVGGQTTTLTAVSHDGTFKWGFSTSGWIGSPTVDVNGLIYFGTRFPDSAVYALGPDMSLKWKIPFSGSLDLRAAPVIGADGTLYIGANNQSGTAPTLFAIGI